MITTYGQVLVQPSMPVSAFTTGAHVGTAVDTGVFGNNFRSAEYILTTGVITDGNHTVTVQECDTSGGTYTAVDPSRVQGALSAALVSTDSSKQFQIGVRPTKRFLQLVVTSAGTTTGGIFSSVCALSNSSVGPVARS